MATTLNPATPEKTSYTDLARTALRAALGGEFALWQRVADGWSAADLTQSAATPFANGEPPNGNSHGWNAWLDSLWAAGPGSPCVYTSPAGDTRVALVVEGPDGEPELLVGTSTATPEQLVSHAAISALREIEFDAGRQLIDDYATRLSASFEELTFLRRLSRHIEYCVADRSLGETASAILPQLLELLGIEGICLIGRASCDDQEASRVLGFAGQLPADEAYWPRFVQSQVPLTRRVIVKNFQSMLFRGECSPLPGLSSFVLAPIEKDSVNYGWLLGINKRLDAAAHSAWSALGHDEIGSMEASLLEAAARMLGSHAANHQLFREKERLVVDVIHTLVGVIEARDAYTCGHSDRVALVARLLGTELRLPETECQDIYLSGLLHDIGKIGVTDDVLLKPGQLSEEEFAQIKKHPVIGAQMLGKLRPLEDLVPGVLYHHEAFDGSGYPHGLAGQQIPQMARVLAVADAFDAMTSSRPYRPGMPREKAESILRDGAGRQWDPEVVAAYFAKRDAIAEVADHWHNHLGSLLGYRQKSQQLPAGTD